MTVIQIGVLSDTHLAGPTDLFRRQLETCFAGVPIIFHAGDLTDLSILQAFNGREVHAVHGNMCSAAVRANLPRKKVIEIGGFIFGLIHNVGYSYDFEEQLLDELAEADCIVFGHTHRPLCRSLGPYLLFNPGSFNAVKQPTFGILEVGQKISGRILEVPAL